MRKAMRTVTAALVVLGLCAAVTARPAGACDKDAQAETQTSSNNGGK